jgi:tetratricopeptide (TPR) repeat protein
MIIHTRIRYSIFLIISLILLIHSSAVSNDDTDADRIFNENSKAVVVVTAYDKKGNAISRGSGFIVRADGAVVTNYHVIGMARDIKVTAGDKILDVEGLIFTDEGNDLVILKAKAKDMPVVKLGVIGKANIGERVYVISSPEGLENTISDGLLNGIRKIDEKKEVLQMTATTSHGSSGGPVFNRDGEVIGVATSGMSSDTRNLSFAMSVKLIKDKISSKRITSIKKSGLEDYENTATYWNGLGVAYGESGSYEQAIEAFKQAIRINPDYVHVHYNLGAAFIKLGMHKEGLEACKQAIRIDPAIAEAHYNLGFAYVNLGRYKEAIEACKQAIWINPTFAEPYYTLGAAYVKLGINKEGMEAFKQAIRIDPDYAEARYLLGATYTLLNDKVSALEQYKILKSLDPEKANELFNLIYK